MGIFENNEMIEVFFEREGREYNQSLLVVNFICRLDMPVKKEWNSPSVLHDVYEVLKNNGMVERIAVDTQTLNVLYQFDGITDAKIRKL